MGTSPRFAVTGSGRFSRIDHVPQTGSTNDDLVAAATIAPHDARVLIADEQLTGKGRRDRTWAMPPGGGLLISFFVPWTTSDNAHLIPTCLGVAAVEAVATFDRTVMLKWPNDLVDEHDQKIGGMLSSAVFDDGAFVGVVAGLGCNVSWPPSGMTELPNATCLDRLGDDPVDRVELATKLVAAFDDALTDLLRGGASPLHDRYRASSRTIGQQVRVERSGDDLVGRATDVDPSGALLLDVNGVQHRVDVGDVVHLRPSS